MSPDSADPFDPALEHVASLPICRVLIKKWVVAKIFGKREGDLGGGSLARQSLGSFHFTHYVPSISFPARIRS